MRKSRKISSPGKYLLYILLPSFLFLANISGQELVTGSVINEYASVSQHWINPGGRDSVSVDAPEKFSVEDIVMLYVVKGFNVDTDPDEGDPKGGVGNIGQYALMVVEGKRANTIIFNNTSGFENPPAATDPVIQLIKVAVYDSAVVQNSLTAPAWDSTSGTGGVVAIYARGRLKLEADIDVSGKGFIGATPDPTDTYSGTCYVAGQEYLNLSESELSGLKGEGASKSNLIMRRGLGASINGGGGGNGNYSGGGGGGNYNSGGDAYGQSGDGGCTENIGGGIGGIGLEGETLYANAEDDGVLKNRIFFGGGGGTGVYDASGVKSSPGGNGGGIVVIIADRLDWDAGVQIHANGDSVKLATEGGGGGGGAGGCIVLDVSKFKGDGKLTLSAIGGQGGSTNDGLPLTGPGGGGGGGIYWLSKYDANVIDTINSGENGGQTNAGNIRAIAGGEAGLKTDLQAPLAGFLFNTLPLFDSVCTDIDPAPSIDASKPKGGVVNGPDYEYTYKWLESATGVLGTFVPATGVNNQRNYAFTAPLTSHMHYRRVVEDDNTLVDTSAIFTYYTLDKIEGNTIRVPDSLVCYGLTTLDLQPSGILSGAYITTTDSSFLWQKKLSGGSWEDADDINNQRDYNLPEMFDTTSFRRIVSSGVCTSISNTVRIKVLNPVKNNLISSKDTLCFGQSPDVIDGTDPLGGDPAFYWYDWEKAYREIGPYSVVGPEDKDLDITDSTFNSNRWLRRIVYSGEDSSCVYSSDTLKIEVIPLIAFNTIETPDLLLCEDSLNASGIEGRDVIGGDGDYTFKWQTSPDQAVWTTRQNDPTNLPLGIPSYGEKTYVRRVVVSGKDSVCVNYSGVQTIDILPKLTGNVIKDTTVIVCENDALDLALSGSVIGGGAGAGNYSYQWISSRDGSSGSWSVLSGSDAQNFTISQLDSTRHFRRVVWSDKTLATCIDTTSEVFIYEVPDSILNNIIQDGLDYKEICFGTQVGVDGSVPEKGYTPGTYNYRWYYGPDESSLNDSLPGNNSQSVPPAGISTSTVFQRMVYDDYCRSLSEPVKIHVRALPVATLALATGQDNVICENTIQLDINIVNGETHSSHDVIISYTSDEGSGTLDFDANLNDIFTISHDPATSDSATYYYELVEVVDDSGCVATVLNGSPSIKVFQKPEPSILSDSVATCGEVTLVMGSNRNGATEAEWVQLTPGAQLVTFDDDTMRQTYMRLIKADGYDETEILLGWKLSTPRCDSTVSRVFTFFEFPENTELLADTVEFYVEEAFDLSQFEPDLDAGIGTWTVDNSGASLLEDSITATDFIYETRHVYLFTVKNGICEPQVDDLTLIQHDLRQFNAFSPNNDPLNQEFVIPGLIHADEFTFTLFNSWGTKIRTVTKDNAELREVEIDGRWQDEYLVWDGTLGDGEAAQSGTYYYTLQYTIEGRVFKPKNGYIMLRR